jgi:hypothetical protein
MKMKSEKPEIYVCSGGALLQLIELLGSVGLLEFAGLRSY